MAAVAVEGVEVVCETMLKPFFLPSSPSHHLLGTRVPLTTFDMANYNCHIATIHAFRPPFPGNATMRESLAKALAYFPYLAGRLVPDENGYPHIVLNNAGARFREATAPTTLEENLPIDGGSNLSNLHPHPAEAGEVLLQVQLTRFSSGGLVLGLTAHHRVADGSSMCHFLFTWAKLVRGLDVDVVPYFDRSAVLTPRDPPRCEFDHLGVEFKPKLPVSTAVDDVVASLSKMRNLAVHFSRDFIAKLKHKVTGGDPDRRASTFLCVLTHTWKKVALARGLADDEVTHVRLVVNGRHRMKPPVPAEYFGNLVLWAFPRMRAGELLRRSYSDVAQVIRDAVNSVEDRYFKSFIDFGASVIRGDEGREVEATIPVAGEFLNPNVEFNSWLSLPFHELDFGGGTPCAFLPPGIPVEGMMVLAPSCGEDGGVNIYTALEKEHADLFHQVCHSLD